jgi:hypothetical protein
MEPVRDKYIWLSAAMPSLQCRGALCLQQLLHFCECWSAHSYFNIVLMKLSFQEPTGELKTVSRTKLRLPDRETVS